jgi:hypothetical protein
MGEIIESLKKNEDITTYDEASIKQAVVMRLLSTLGWNIFDVEEVKLDHESRSQHIDFALRDGENDRVFIKVQSGTGLQKHQKDLVTPAIKDGIDYAVLTNGVAWWFYLTATNSKIEKRRFCAIDLFREDTDVLVELFIDLLEKSSIDDGEALKTAQKLHQKQLQKVIEESLPEAWSKMLSGPDPALLKLLGESTKKLCGYAPSKEILSNFLVERLRLAATGVEAKAGKTKTAARSFDGQIIESFSFKGETYKVGSWDDLLIKLCNILKTKHKKDVDRLLWHQINGRYYFNKIAEELRFPEPVPGTNIYAETNLGPNKTVRAAYSILQLYGYSRNELFVALAD